MSLIEILRGNLERSGERYRDLIAALPERALGQKLPGLRSNTIGAQLWCVIGARESYGRAIVRGEWTGFSCSLDGARTGVREDVFAALASSGRGVLDVLAGMSRFTDPQQQLVVDLLEHEAAHQGQLIRYLYGLDLPIPSSWKSKYALD